MELGGAREDDFTLDVEGELKDEEDVDVDALDTDDDEAEDQALGIDTEESDSELRAPRVDANLSFRFQSQCTLSRYILCSPLKNR